MLAQGAIPISSRADEEIYNGLGYEFNSVTMSINYPYERDAMLMI